MFFLCSSRVLSRTRDHTLATKGARNGAASASEDGHPLWRSQCRVQQDLYGLRQGFYRFVGKLRGDLFLLFKVFKGVFKDVF